MKELYGKQKIIKLKYNVVTGELTDNIHVHKLKLAGI